MNNEEVIFFDCRNVGSIVEMRDDSAEEKFEFFVGFFQQILTVIHWDFSLFFSEFSGVKRRNWQ